MFKDHLVPLSILVGATIIGLGLYFGLQRQQRPEAGLPSPLPAPSPTTSTFTPSPSPLATSGVGEQAALPPQPGRFPVTPPAASPAIQTAADQAAVSALSVEKKTNFVPKCWVPSVQKSATPANAKYRLEMMFGADGVEIGRGIHEDRAATRDDVASCLRNMPIGLRISPPGAPVLVSLALEFP